MALQPPHLFGCREDRIVVENGNAMEDSWFTMNLKLVPIDMDSDEDKRRFEEVVHAIMKLGCWERKLLYFDDGSALLWLSTDDQKKP